MLANQNEKKKEIASDLENQETIEVINYLKQ